MAGQHHNAHSKPPQAIRDVYKRLQRAKAVDIANERTTDPAEFRRERSTSTSVSSAPASPRAIFEEFTGKESPAAPIYLPEPETCEVPGKVSRASQQPPF